MPDQKDKGLKSVAWRQLSLTGRSSSFHSDHQSQGALAVGRSKSVLGSGDAARRAVTSGRWADAGAKVMQAQRLASSFRTLRDQREINNISRDEIKTIKKLGEGGFATVNLCSYNGRLVAVKCLKPAKMPLEDYESFIREAALIRKLKHKYIIDYVGIGYYNNSSDEAKLNSMFIVQEFMDKGTLKDLVSKQMLSPRPKLYSNEQALEWLLQLAEALAYLHSAIPMVIHRDLKLENVLLTTEQNTLPSPVAKLSDFGLSAFVRRENRQRRSMVMLPPDTKLCGHAWHHCCPPASSSPLKDQGDLRSSAESTMERMGTLQKPLLEKVRLSPVRPPPFVRMTTADLVNKLRMNSELRTKPMPELSGQAGSYMYMSPEMFLNKDYNEKVDVFSFGAIAYELLHRYLMVFSVSMAAGSAAEVEAYARSVSQGYRPPIGAHWPAEIKDLLSQCWDQDPAKRPAMSEVVQRIRRMLDDDVLGTAESENAGCCSLQ